MIRPHRGPRPRTWALFALVVLVGACAGHVFVPSTSPFYGSSLTPYDALVRHQLLDPDEAGLEAIRDVDGGDEVVRLMNEGELLHRMGRYEESNAALQRAERISTERYDQSLGQQVASFIVSDNVLDYQPSALERSMIHYYGMFNYLALGDADEALVEARKVNALLRRYHNDFPGRSFVNDAAVQYLAGMLQWGEGEENDAIVSLRQSVAGYDEYRPKYGVPAPVPVAVDLARIADAFGLEDVAERTREQYPEARAESEGVPARDREMGDVVLVIENGFIAHKRQQKLFVPILRSERDSLVAGSAASAVEAAFRVVVRTAVIMTDMSREGQSYVQAHEDGVTFVSGALSVVGLELITMAWPVYELEAHRATRVQVSTAEGVALTPTVLSDLSAIAVRDFEERKTSMLLRMIARTLFKEAGVVQSGRAGERAGGVFGGLAARVAARTLANATERADTREWAGLPAELLVTRLRLPPGEHELSVNYEGLRGPETLTVTVDVVPGGVTLRTLPIAGRDRGDRSRFERATRDVRYEPPKRPGR